MCDFEDDECPLVGSVGMKDTWNKVRAQGNVITEDNTLLRGEIQVHGRGLNN